ncbi:MAG TPA: DHA2 family efflux MFS transporter permease subunit [Methylomirabilota bacterium]|jgi:DHA2 family multidrug resistance protein|nr:DHA2 family efflux MFS transporter permease subunit [Methylomirabilota bacterium]
MTPPAPEEPISPARRWAITVTVMVVAFMQILDTSVTNVILPHLQGSLSAGLDEVSWVITSYLAANAVIIPATGWLAGLFGRKRFFLICATLFVVSSFISGAAPDLTTLIVARIFQGLGGGPIIPLSQAILWEIFPLHQRGLAMAIWGVGFILGPILGPTVGGYLADEWSWRWIFYINLPVGILGFLMASAFLFDSPYQRRAARIDWWGLGLMIAGFGCLQLVLDRGEREDWFDSGMIVALAIVAVCALAGFLIRELTTGDPILDLAVFTDRNFAMGATLSAIVGFGMFSGMLLVAVFTQKLLGYDAWTSGLVLAPGGLGNIFSLFSSGLVTRIDQRLMLAFGCLLNAVSLYLMTSLTLGMDYWALAGPRFLQGFAVGFIFVPMSTLTLATIRRDKLVNATAVYGMMRNIGGSVGIAVVTTLLAQRSQFHQATLVSHVTAWDPETHARLTRWASHFATLGSDAFTAERRAVAMLYRETVAQAQLLAYADDFWLLAVMFAAVPLFLPLMRRIRMEPPSAGVAGTEPSPTDAVKEGAV